MGLNYVKNKILSTCVMGKSLYPKNEVIKL